MKVVVKIGTSSITDEVGRIRVDAIQKICSEIATLRKNGHDVVLVTSGAISAGLPLLGFEDGIRPKDAVTLQALSAVGQSRLMETYNNAFAQVEIIAAQILLAPLDFWVRQQYLQATATLSRLLELGVVPIVNENDAIADDEIRFGDNDRIAALVANLISADVLVLLTDTNGLYTADPRKDSSAIRISLVTDIDENLRSIAGNSGTHHGSGGMSSKIAAAAMATRAGVRTVIASAQEHDVVRQAVEESAGNIGTTIFAHKNDWSARKLWLAFATEPQGKICVDDGAKDVLHNGGASLLAAGVTGVEGEFHSGEGVSIVSQNGEEIGRGVMRVNGVQAREFAGKRSNEVDDPSHVLYIHVDDLIIWNQSSAHNHHEHP